MGQGLIRAHATSNHSALLTYVYQRVDAGNDTACGIWHVVIRFLNPAAVLPGLPIAAPKVCSIGHSCQGVHAQHIGGYFLTSI
jgi:hypothetical protein